MERLTLSSLVREVNPVEIGQLPLLSANRTLVLGLDCLLDAVRAEDVAAGCGGGLIQGVPTHRACEDWLLWRNLRRNMHAVRDQHRSQGNMLVRTGYYKDRIFECTE